MGERDSCALSSKFGNGLFRLLHSQKNRTELLFPCTKRSKTINQNQKNHSTANSFWKKATQPCSSCNICAMRRTVFPKNNTAACARKGCWNKLQIWEFSNRLS